MKETTAVCSQYKSLSVGFFIGSVHDKTVVNVSGRAIPENLAKLRHCVSDFQNHRKNLDDLTDITSLC